jgi:hypothetical protein
MPTVHKRLLQTSVLKAVLQHEFLSRVLTEFSVMNNLVLAVMAVIAIVIVAMALSGTNSDVAKVIQGGLIIAIIAVLVRDVGNQNLFFSAWHNLTNLAVSTTGKQASS